MATKGGEALGQEAKKSQAAKMEPRKSKTKPAVKSVIPKRVKIEKKGLAKFEIFTPPQNKVLLRKAQLKQERKPKMKTAVKSVLPKRVKIRK